MTNLTVNPVWEPIQATFSETGKPFKVHLLKQDNRLQVMTEDKSGLTQFPVRDKNGTRYDYPFMVPKYGRKLVEIAFQYKEKIEKIKQGAA